MSEESNIEHILELMRRDTEGYDPYANKPEDCTPDSNDDGLTYEEYIRDFYRETDLLDPDGGLIKEIYWYLSLLPSRETEPIR